MLLNSSKRGTAFILFTATILCIVRDGFSQFGADTLLFTIDLNGDSGTLFDCQWVKSIDHTLSGPVLMENNTLLFYSRNGYVLYSLEGKRIDDHSLFNRNRRLARKGLPLIVLAYPYDAQNILYYRTENAGDLVGSQIFMKRLRRGGLTKVNGKNEPAFEKLGRAQPFNLAHNIITDEMVERTYPMPNLVGHCTNPTKMMWWCLDNFYSFSSPLLVEEVEKGVSLFTGLRKDRSLTAAGPLIQPLSVIQVDGLWHYYGINIPGDLSQSIQEQVVFIADHAGNHLYTVKLKKRTVTDAVLSEDEKQKMIYTVRRPVEHVFLPAAHPAGDIYYGKINYKKATIEVRKLPFLRYRPVPSGPRIEDHIDRQSRFSLLLGSPECGDGIDAPIFYPRVWHMDTVGNERELEKRDLEVKGYVTTIVRPSDDALKKKMGRPHRQLPKRIQHLRDSVAAQQTTWCPFGVCLESKGGVIRTMHYASDEKILGARIVSVTATGEIFIRVDLENRAEILILTETGEYRNRFVFNRQNIGGRKDIIAVSSDGLICEKDFEIIDGGYRFYLWKRRAGSE